MLPLYKMGNTEDPFLNSMIPGGYIRRTESRTTEAQSCDNSSSVPTAPFSEFNMCGVILLSTDFETITNTCSENSLNVSKIQQAPKNVDQT